MRRRSHKFPAGLLYKNFTIWRGLLYLIYVWIPHLNHAHSVGPNFTLIWIYYRDDFRYLLLLSLIWPTWNVFLERPGQVSRVFKVNTKMKVSNAAKFTRSVRAGSCTVVDSRARVNLNFQIDFCSLNYGRFSIIIISLVYIFSLGGHENTRKT